MSQVGRQNSDNECYMAQLKRRLMSQCWI